MTRKNSSLLLESLKKMSGFSHFNSLVCTSLVLYIQNMICAMTKRSVTVKLYNNQCLNCRHQIKPQYVPCRIYIQYSKFSITGRTLSSYNRCHSHSRVMNKTANNHKWSSWVSNRFKCEFDFTFIFIWFTHMVYSTRERNGMSLHIVPFMMMLYWCHNGIPAILLPLLFPIILINIRFNGSSQFIHIAY